jgi:hypothetical protein
MDAEIYYEVSLVSDKQYRPLLACVHAYVLVDYLKLFMRWMWLVFNRFCNDRHPNYH